MTLLQTTETPLPDADAGTRPPVWSQIAAHLTAAIARGTYTPGERLPPEHTLAETFGVNRHTVRRALASLCSQGVLRSTQGSGTYVQAFAVDLVLSRRTRHRQNLALAGFKGSLQVLTHDVVGANATQARLLAVPPRRRLLHLWVLGEAQGQPLSVSERLFPLQRFPQLLEVLQKTGSVTEAFAAHGVTDYLRRESHITAELPDPVVAAHLHQPQSQPVLRVDSVNVDPNGVPIEAATAWFPADRISLTVQHGE